MEIDFGLKPHVIRRIQDVFGKHPEVKKVIIYGSRAKGTFREESDIDLTMVGNISFCELGDISEELDDLLLPWKIDLSVYNDLKNENLKNHIDSVGKNFYQQMPSGYKAEKSVFQKKSSEMEKEKVLFICIHNSARSQMAEGYLRHFAEDRYEVWSAGLEPGRLNPFVVRAMKEDGVDISSHRTNSVYEFTDGHIAFDYVITVCDETAAEACPFFPGQDSRLHWGFTDPSKLSGGEAEKMKAVRDIRNAVREQVKAFAAASS